MPDLPQHAETAPRESSVDEERSQALVRVVMPIVCGLMIAAFAWQDNLSLASAYNYSVPVVLGYGVFGVGWLALVSHFPSRMPSRRVVVIFGDLGAISWGMIQLAETGVVFYPLYLWVIVGNGMRFGANSLVTALIVGQFGFASCYLFSDYWGANLTLGLSLQAAMIVLPLFYLTLMRRMHSLNERLAEEAERSRAMAASKAQFLANMSHELRTPMNGVLGVTQLLGDTRLNGHQHELLELIRSSADSLLNIINDILDYSKVDAGKLVLEERAFNLRRCVNDVVQLLDHKASEKGLSISHSYPEDALDGFLGDRTRIRQILMNLVGNAIKFTEQGEIRVICSVKPVVAGQCEIELEVRDSGIGIAPENLERIFDQFEQADSSTARKFGGTGLGLAISRKLANAMQGELTVFSEQNSGTSFVLRIQLASTVVSSVTEEPRQRLERNYDVTALVAEDNRVNQMVAKGLLTKLGINVDIAENGEVAIAKVNQGDYQLIFMDMQMPVLGGVEATKIIRAMPGAKGALPIVALSANLAAVSMDDGAGVQAGKEFDAFVDKPFTLQDIVAVVDELLPASPAA